MMVRGSYCPGPDCAQSNGRLRSLIGLGLVLFILCLYSCGLFDTRTPESPVQSNSTYVPPTEPGMVFTNMIAAFKEVNTVNYLKSFADSGSSGRIFVFQPTNQYSALLSFWSKQSEQQYFDNMKTKLQQGSVPSLSFESLTAQTIQSDSAVYEAVYRLSIPHTQSDIPKEARGKAQFVLVTDQARNWAIYRWYDYPDAQNDFPWSGFKEKFGQ